MEELEIQLIKLVICPVPGDLAPGLDAIRYRLTAVAARESDVKGGRVISARPVDPVWGRGTFPGKLGEPLFLPHGSKCFFRLRIKTGSISAS